MSTENQTSRDLAIAFIKQSFVDNEIDQTINDQFSEEISINEVDSLELLLVANDIEGHLNVSITKETIQSWNTISDIVDTYVSFGKSI